MENSRIRKTGFSVAQLRGSPERPVCESGNPSCPSELVAGAHLNSRLPNPAAQAHPLLGGAPEQPASESGFPSWLGNMVLAYFAYFPAPPPLGVRLRGRPAKPAAQARPLLGGKFPTLGTYPLVGGAPERPDSQADCSGAPPKIQNTKKRFLGTCVWLR